MALAVGSRFKSLQRGFLANLASQGGTVLLNLAFLKTAVTWFSPEDYGSYTLWMGGYTLVRGVAFMPLMQFLLLHYWNYPSDHQRLRAEQGIKMCLMAIVAVSWLILLPISMVMKETDALLFLAQAALVGAFALGEASISMRLIHVHLLEDHFRFGFWTTFPALLRIPLLFLLRHLFGPSSWVILSAWALTSGLMQVLIQKDPLLKRLPMPSFKMAEFSSWRDYSFLLPLALIGVTTWVLALSDRFFIASLLGVSNAAFYATTYALGSMPFIILSQSAILVLRPRLQRQAAACAWREYRHNLLRYLLVVTLLAIILGLVTWSAGPLLVRLLLHPLYLQGLVALPGILLGQIFMVIGQAAETDLYIRGKSRHVLYKQSIAVVSACISIPILVFHFGLAGAGTACAIYYAVEAVVGILYSTNDRII